MEKIIARTETPKFRGALENQEPRLVLQALSKSKKTEIDFALLLSKGADNLLETIAVEAQRVKLWRFGKAIQLYAPLYLSNKCANDCPYCGFNAYKKIKRKILSIQEVIAECKALADVGMQHILLVSGSVMGGFDFLKEAAKQVRAIVPSVSVEVPSLTESQYRELVDVGVNGVTLYQETYCKKTYDRLHQKGDKIGFENRLDAIERAGNAGIRNLTVGALWGLSNWRLEALRLGLHVQYLQKRFWKSNIAMGLPRLHDVPDDYTIDFPVNNRAFVHIIVALRVYLEEAGLVVSTREQAGFRDKLIPLGITQMSAGSKTEPGGYKAPGATGQQFDVTDSRSVQEVHDTLKCSGYDPVFKDWERIFI